MQFNYYLFNAINTFNKKIKCISIRITDRNSMWLVDGSFSLSSMLTFSINAKWLVQE